VDLVSYQAHQKNLEVLLRISPAIPRYLQADAVRLRQILVNLLGNAVKFTHHGEIELKVELVEAIDLNHNILRFAVRDTGIGIAPKNIVKIFEAFSQEDASVTRRFGGTGLGLTISNKLLSLMNSQLQLESELDKGVRFSSMSSSKVMRMRILPLIYKELFLMSWSLMIIAVTVQFWRRCWVFLVFMLNL
jgi:signal transduction histidine kinase